jgi:hypothetical protein
MRGVAPDEADDAHGAVAVRPLPAPVYFHYSGGNRRVATFLTKHLASHGYVVAALDHSEVVSARLQQRDGETAEERETRVQGWVDNRVPDIGFLLDAVVPAGGRRQRAGRDRRPQLRRMDCTDVGGCRRTYRRVGWTFAGSSRTPVRPRNPW